MRWMLWRKQHRPQFCHTENLLATVSYQALHCTHTQMGLQNLLMEQGRWQPYSDERNEVLPFGVTSLSCATEVYFRVEWVLWRDELILLAVAPWLVGHGICSRFAPIRVAGWTNPNINTPLGPDPFNDIVLDTSGVEAAVQPHVLIHEKFVESQRMADGQTFLLWNNYSPNKNASSFT